MVRIFLLLFLQDVRSTEVYICSWQETYECRLVSEPEKTKEEFPLIFNEPYIEDPEIKEDEFSL